MLAGLKQTSKIWRHHDDHDLLTCLKDCLRSVRQTSRCPSIHACILVLTRSDRGGGGEKSKYADTCINNWPTYLSGVTRKRNYHRDVESSSPWVK